MNKNLYRIVFNRALGLFQVVAEIARRGGSGAGSGASAAGSRFLATLSPLCFAIALALGQAVIIARANAQVAADPNAPGNQRPTVLEAANGVPLINIQTPSAAGVSRNTYRQFDVDRSGAILNNARVNTQTQLGGWVQGNPWLARGTARVILNEVNASDPSRLNGYVEVAGDRAQVVIANPAGISCDGCGFINADRATLTTGMPIINSGSLEGYRVQGGAIQIHGQGMDAGATNYTDLIARSVQANAGIWAQRLNVTTGANQVSADHGKVRKTAASGDAPAFALDVGALGGMYSQKIVLVGTEHGVGVRNAGAIGAQTGQLVVTVDGRLENRGTTQARTDIRIDASGGLANTGTLSAGRELAVNTPEDIDNRRGTLNARRIEATARSLTNRDGAIGQTGLQDLVLQTGQTRNRDGGRIGLAAPRTDTPSGNANVPKASADGRTDNTGGSPPRDGNAGGGKDPLGSGVASLPDGVLNIAATLENDGGRIMAGGHIDLTARDGLDNDGGHLGVRQLDVRGGGLSNHKGQIKVAAAARLTTGLLNNDAGLMQLAGPVALNAQGFSNRAGAFQQSDKSDTHIKIKGQLDNSGGTLASNARRLTLDAGQLFNTGGQIAHSGDAGLAVNAGTFRGAGGNTATMGSAILRLGESDHRNATLSAKQVDLSAQSFDNRGGRIIATGNESSRLDVTGTLDNRDSGAIASNGDLRINAATLGNANGKILHAGDGRLDIEAGTLHGENGSIAGNGALTLKSDTTDLTGATTQARQIRIDTGALTNAGGAITATGTGALSVRARERIDNTSGAIAGNGTLDLHTGTLINQDGRLQATGSGDNRIAVAGQFDNRSGSVAATGNITLQADRLNNQGGSIAATDQAALTVSIDGTLDNSARGTLAAAGDLTLSAPVLDNREGAIRHAGEGPASVSAGDLRGANGSITSNGALDIRGGNTDLSGGSTFGERIRIDTGRLFNTGGQLIATGEGQLWVRADDRVDNTGGMIAGNGALALQAGSLVNRDGTVLGARIRIDTRKAVLDNAGGAIASTVGALGIDSGALNNARGLLQSRQGMRVDTHGQALVNTDAGSTGGILSGDALALNSGDLNNRDGVVHSQGDLIARTGGIDNTAGQLGGSADVDIGATSIDNAGGKIQAGHDLKALVSGVANNNGGLMVTGNGLTLNAAQILNRDTQSANASQPLGLQGDSVILTAAHTDNTGGTITADSRIGIRGPDAASQLDNAQGNLSSRGSIDVAVSHVLNPLGTLIAGSALNLTADSLGGDGSLLSGGGLSLIIGQDFTNSREITANGHALISTAGLLTNHGVLQAGDLDVRGTRINNSVTGEISGARITVIAHDTLTNRGLIDGSQTRIEADTLDNVGSGRLYGDRLAIRGGTISNREEDGRAAVLAARQRLDIGASVINNREKALIFSAGGGSDALNIGGILDANDQAAGRAGLILNDSAVIESLGGLTLDSARLLNRNLHLRTELAQIGGPTKHFYIQPEGDPEKHDASEYRWEKWSGAGRYRHNQTGADAKAWTEYDVTQTEYETQVMESAPALIRASGNMTLRGDELINDKSQIIAGGILRGDLARLDNVAAPGEHVTHQTGTSRYTYAKKRKWPHKSHKRRWDSKITYAPADIVKTVELNVSSVEQNAAGAGSGFALTARRQTGQVDAASVDGNVRAPGGTGARQITEVRAQVNRVHSPEVVTGARVTDGNGPVQIPAQAVAGVNGETPMIIRTVQADTGAPANSLFRAGPDAGGYLVETDPRFADYRNWLSSDYMLSQLGHDPATVHKRLGDGFYEQKLVRDQIGQLTGRRFLDSYASDEAQYRALLEAGVTYAKAWNLRPGVALSAEQMAQLTSDIVWLVERDVTLADGSTTRALTPQVYVRVKPGDIDGNGTLLAASAIDINLKGDLVNVGAIAGRAAVKLTGENLRNLGGRITADAVALNGRTDIDNIGGTLDARSRLVLDAGRDLNVASTTHSDARQAGRSDFSRTNLDRVAGLYVTRSGGVLLASAGRDANLIAARVVNSGKDGQTAVVAGRDLTLSAVRTAEQENNVRNASNYLRQGNEQDVGSTIATAGDARLQAGRTLSAIAASVTSEQGALTAVAQGDVNILAGAANSNWAEGRQHQSSSLLGSSKKTTRDSLEETRAVASTFSGRSVAVQGQNVTVTGSNVVSDAGTVIVARDDLRLQAATETSKESHFKEIRNSGFLYNGGLAFTIGSQMQSGDRQDVSTRAAAATVGATGGRVTLAAGNQYQQAGSQVLAPQGDIDIHAQKVDIVQAQETGQRVEQSKFRQSGLTVALSAPVLSAIETAGQLKRAASQTTDGRMQALGAAATGLAAKNAYDAVQADPQAGGGVSISITVGASKSDSKSTATYETAAGSTVAAGGDVRIRATGGGGDSNLTVRGSNIRAGGDAVLKADGDINLLAAKNTVETDRKSSSVSAGVGVAISVGQGGASFGVTANASGSRGKGEGRDVTWSNSHVTAGERLTLESGNDTRLRGAVASGRQVVADVGGNLDIESLQDTSAFKSKDQSIGGSVTAGVGFAASGSYASNKVDGDFASVMEQSRIEAGDDGFQIRVQDNTRLKGAAIASSEQAVKRGFNTVQTGSLTVSDVENHSRYKATGVSLSGGFSVAGDAKQPDGKKEGGSSAKQADAAASNAAGQGSTWSVQNFGNSVSAGAPGMSVREGSENNVTHSGISGAAVTITDMNAQWERTGKTADQVLAMLDRSVLAGAGGGGLTKKWDGDKLRGQVQAEAQIVAAFGQQAGAAIERHAQQKRADLRQQIKATQDPEKIKALQAQINEINTQERLLNVAVGALSGSGGVAAVQAGLSEAADRMRRYTIADSEKFAGITDGETTLDNKSGESAGIRGDGFKTAGTRVVLDKLCGPMNGQCKKQVDSNGKEIQDEKGIPKLKLDGTGHVQFYPSKAGMTLAKFLESDRGKDMAGLTGGNQGGPGTLFGFPYSSGGILDLVHEAYGGSHDFISGTLSGYYDEQGNARRGLTPVQKGLYEIWTGIALVPATPFALSEALPPQAWKALDILLRMKR